MQKWTNENFKTSKMDCRCQSFPLFRLIEGAFQEDCCQFSGLWHLALLPLGRPLIWKIYQTFFHCKQNQNLWTPCLKIWWTLGFPGNKEQLWSKKMSCWPQSQVASSEKGRFKYPLPRWGQSKHPTPGTIPGPARPPPPTHLHSCLFYLFELTLCSIRSNEGYPLILGNKIDENSN